MGRNLPRVGVHALALLATVTALMSVDGCSESSGYCQPAPLGVAPSVVRAGSYVELSSPAASCSLGLGKSAKYVVRFFDHRSKSLRRLGTVPVSSDGVFRARLRIPRDASPGRAELEVDAPGHSFCNDRNESCPGYTIQFIVVRPK